MIFNEIYVNRKPRDREAKTSLTDWFIGSYERAKEILSKIDDSGSSAVTQFWTARFTDRESQIAFVLVWPNSRLVEDPDGVDVWVVPDIVALEFLRDRRGVILTECLEITFSSRKMRTAFLAHTDH
jgi:hypothetical protein